MVRAKARQLSHENAALKQQIAELTEQLEAEALVDSLRREENQQLLAMLGDTTSGYVALPRNIAKLCRDSLALANLPGNQEAINELDGQINATLKKENT